MSYFSTTTIQKYAIAICVNHTVERRDKTYMFAVSKDHLSRFQVLECESQLLYEARGRQFGSRTRTGNVLGTETP